MGQSKVVTWPNLISPFFKMANVLNQRHPTSFFSFNHVTHSLSTSLSLCFSFLSPLLTVSFPLPFRRLTFVEGCKCRTWREPNRLRTNAWSPGRRRAMVQLPLADKTTTSCHHFWPISTPSDLLSQWNHLFWNELLTLYKTIPP